MVDMSYETSSLQHGELFVRSTHIYICSWMSLAPVPLYFVHG